MKKVQTEMVKERGATYYYSLYLDRELRDTEYTDLLQLVSKERRKRVQSYRLYKDSQRSLLGDILARYIIVKRSGVRNGELRFTNNPYGKPMLIVPEGTYFNISHSGDWIVGATDSFPVGIDVEEIQAADMDIAERFFSTAEYRALASESPETRNDAFYILWTLKESYIKAEGQGLSMGLDTFTVTAGSTTVQHEHGVEEKHLQHHKLDERHMLALCASPGRIWQEKQMSLSQFMQTAIRILY